SKDSNCKGDDAAGSGMGRTGGDVRSGGDGICGNRDDNGLDPPLDPHHRHPPLDPHPDQTQECILVTQQWVRQ
nr:hypothetical protein [Tanacetum cinerariifolium]